MAADSVIGVDLGGTKLLAGVVDGDLNVHHRGVRRSRGADESEVLETVVGAVEESRDAAEGEVIAVGFGIPSVMDLRRGVAVSTTHLPLRGVPFRDVMAERLGLPVFVDNDANAALRAEQRFGAAAGARTAVMLTVGTGIGGALLIDGRIVHGADGAAGEFGHVVVEMDGLPCPCGGVGCLETVVSGTALAREGTRVGEATPESALGRVFASGRPITGALVTELAHDGDRAARDVVALLGTRLGVALAGIVNVVNPEVIVVGGGVIAAGDMLLEPAREVLRERALLPGRDTVRVVPARFGDESGMLGAALLAFDGLAAASAPA